MVEARPMFRPPMVKPFCPCDAGSPDDCNAEEWPGAHSPSSCLNCGAPNYQHIYSASDEPDEPIMVMYCRGNHPNGLP